MLGFLTLVALLFAVAQGGWSWAVFGLMFLLWLAKRDQAKNQVGTATNTETDVKRSEAKAPLETAEKPETDVDPVVTVSGDWPPDLVDACLTLSAPNYYVGDLIPETKREAAMAAYPPPGDGEILALIDCTVFGSAKDGLAVGHNGISWRNSMPVQMPWSDLARAWIGSTKTAIAVGSVDFSTVGSDIAVYEVASFIRRLRDYARSVSPADASSAAVAETNGRKQKVSPKSAINAEPAIPINSAQFEELLALPGIGAAEAQMIIKRRSEKGFTSALDLVDYLDLKPHIATRLEGLIDFGRLPAQPQEEAASTPKGVRSAARPTTLGGRTID